jgi:mannose-6-phosphate isomerase-like protein (cupin superfamily)
VTETQAGSASSGSVAGTSVQVLTELITFKLTTEETGGDYTLVETITAPGGGVPPHVQHQDAEAFYVLEGTYTFVKNDETVTLGPGGHVFIPVGTVHAFQNTGDGPARMLIVNSPGGIHQGFFLEVGVPVEDPANPPAVNMEEQIGRVMEIAPKYGIEMLAPPDAD